MPTFFLSTLYVWHLVCLSFYHVSHAPPWRTSSQYDSLTSTAWKPSCSLCQQKPDVSWTPLCIFSIDVIECKKQMTGPLKQMELPHITSQCRDFKIVRCGSTTSGRTTSENHCNYLHCYLSTIVGSIYLITELQFEAVQVDSWSRLGSQCSHCGKQVFIIFPNPDFEAFMVLRPYSLKFT